MGARLSLSLAMRKFGPYRNGRSSALAIKVGHWRWLAATCLLVGLLVGVAQAQSSNSSNSSFALTNPSSWPLIPIPEVVTDPYSGTTGGLMTVFLNVDSHQQIESIIAPDINYNTLMGAGANFRYLVYPSADTQWYLIGGGAEKKAGSVEADYATGLERRRWWTAEGHFLFQRDPTYEFFGLGNNSHQRNETNYTYQQIYVDGLFGVNFSRHLQLALRERPRWVRTYRGAVTNLPYTRTLFPDLKGLNGGTEMLNQLVLSYDTRNSLTVPTSGGLLALFAGISDRAFLSSSSYTEFAGDFRHYLALGNRVTLAGRIYTRYVPAGNETPFWAMSWMGGDAPGESSLLGLPISDQQTWRGGGSGRYIDNDMFLCNVEVRTRIWSLEVFDTHAVVELAPFIDIGRVFHDPSQLPFADMHPAGGLGFRGLALPFVVAFVDFGYGPDGSAVFSGINYPF